MYPKYEVALVQQGGTTLFKKLAKIAGEIETVSKKGRNEHHGYNYVTEADLLAAVRLKLSAERIAYFFSVIQVVTRDVLAPLSKKDGGYDLLPAKAGSVTEVIVEATFADADTGEQYTVRGAGAGQDPGDKGIYKALTGAQKYLLMKTFLIATGDDPEGDTKVDKANDGAATASKREAKGSKSETSATPAQPTTPSPVKTEARAHGDTAGGAETDAMTLILPGGPYKGTAVGALNLEQAGDLINGNAEKKIQAMPAKNSWTTHVKKRLDYLVEFSKMPEEVKLAANALDLQLG